MKAVLFVLVLAMLMCGVASGLPDLTFEDPTPGNGTIITDTSTQINISIAEQNLDTFLFNWNGTSYTLYNDSLVLAMNLNNVSALGENNTHAVDISNGGNNGTLQNGAAWTTSGKFGSAVEFDGDNDQVVIGNGFHTGVPCTICAWVKTTNYANSQIIASIGDAAGTNYRAIRFIFDVSGHHISASSYDGSTVSAHSPMEYNADVWYHICGVWDAADKRTVYVNGGNSNTNTSNSNVVGDDRAAIGVSADSTPFGYFEGAIDEVRIYNRSLTAGEVQMQYYSNFQKFNLTQWFFNTSITDLSSGLYTYYGWANDTSANGNYTYGEGNEYNSTNPRYLTVGNTTLRAFPYPYKAGLTITSDIDGSSRPEFLAMHQFLNTKQNTSNNTFNTINTNMGIGVGLDIGDSFWMYTRNDITGNDGIDDGSGFSYFNNGTTTKSSDVDLIRAYAHTGHLDFLHSFGNFLGVGGFTRQMGIDALAEMDKAQLTPKICINHGLNPDNHQNIGYDYRTYFHGDLDSSVEYHTDQSLYPNGPFRFLWIDFYTSAAGYDPLSTVTLHDTNKVYALTRYGLPGEKMIESLDLQISSTNLDALISNQSYMFVLQHMGLTTSGPDVHPNFDSDNRAALRDLAQRYEDGDIYVTNTEKLLWYNFVHDNLNLTYEGDCDSGITITITDVADEAFGDFVPTVAELQGITFYTDCPVNTSVILDGADVTNQMQINAADHTGVSSISFPLIALPPMPEWTSNGYTRKTETYTDDVYDYIFSVTNMDTTPFVPTLSYIGFHNFDIQEAKAGDTYYIYNPDGKTVCLSRLQADETLENIEVLNGSYNSSLPQLTHVPDGFDVFEATYNQTSKRVNITVNDSGTIGHIGIIPTSALTINITAFGEPLKTWNESAASGTYALYTVGEGSADTTYVVNIFADANGSTMQTFYVTSNDTGYITYNATGYGYDRWVEITADTSTYATHLTALTPGTAANTITTTTTCADASFGAATLTGGSGSDSEWAGSDVPTGVDIWRDGAGMIAIVVLALLAGIVIVFLRGGGIGEGLTISPNAAIGLAVGLLVLLAVFSIAPIFGDRIDSVADLGQETYATGRLTFVLDGTTADGETVTIDATTLEFDRSADGVTAGRVAVNISDGTAATASQNLTAAINGNATLAAVVVARRDVAT